ncbi:MAG: hypothetical protein K5657_01315 [Desulfovibrio sp.]|nr:hypothetical protein [Desulfovibrio sp.]
MEKAFRVEEEFSGTRLDHYLAGRLGISVRAAKRMILEGRCHMTKTSVSPATRLRPGSLITLPDDPPSVFFKEPPRFLSGQHGFFFFFKPKGLHSVQLAGSSHTSLEELLPTLLPSCTDTLPCLVQRLDCETSGILTAVTTSLVPSFRRAEAAGEIEKRYLALVCGALFNSFVVRNALDTESRRRTRVLPKDGLPLRYTACEPLYVFRAGEPLPDWIDIPALSGCSSDVTLVSCRIASGARHQIRAHLASRGWPLLGDSLYGGGRFEDGFFLHQYMVRHPDALSYLLPSWLKKGFPESILPA